MSFCQVFLDVFTCTAVFLNECDRFRSPAERFDSETSRAGKKIQHHRAVNPIDKTNLDLFRFAHFVALAFVTVYFVHRDWPGLKWPIFRPAIRCGQHSLEVFCFGIFLSFAGHFVLVEISNRAWMQIFVSVAGIALMTALAYLLTWYQGLDKRMAEAAEAARPQPALPSGDRG